MTAMHRCIRSASHNIWRSPEQAIPLSWRATTTAHCFQSKPHAIALLCGNRPVFKGLQVVCPKRLARVAHHRGAGLRRVHRNLRSRPAEAFDDRNRAAPAGSGAQEARIAHLQKMGEIAPRGGGTLAAQAVALESAGLKEIGCKSA